jgi:hypothetical protein
MIIATSVPVDLDVTQLVTQGDLMRAASQAAAATTALAGQGWWLRFGGGRNADERIRRAADDPVIGILLQKSPLLAQFPALVPAAGHLLSATLWSHLSQAEAFRRAAVTYPGLRAPPPPGGVLRECLRRHGLIPAWADLSTLVSELAPDAVATAAVKDAEQPELAVLKAEYLHAPYRVAGRRGRPGVVIWDPARVADPQAALVRLLGEGVTVEGCKMGDPDPADPMDPRTWAGVIYDESEPPPLGFRRRSKAPLTVQHRRHLQDRPSRGCLC